MTAGRLQAHVHWGRHIRHEVWSCCNDFGSCLQKGLLNRRYDTGEDILKFSTKHIPINLSGDQQLTQTRFIESNTGNDMVSLYSQLSLKQTPSGPKLLSALERLQVTRHPNFQIETWALVQCTMTTWWAGCVSFSRPSGTQHCSYEFL